MTTGRGAQRLATTAMVVTAALLGACSSDDGDQSTDADRNTSSSSRLDAQTDTVDWAPPECDLERPEDAPSVSAVDGSETDVDVSSFDGTRIRAHWFPRQDATAEDPAPTVLMGPGWGQPGDTDAETIGILGSINIATLHDAGYNVLTWDPRGFGQSGGTVTVNDPAHEGRDVQTLIDWVATLPEVVVDGESDPTMGMVGASYGGGIQLVTAAIDCRVDAIVPTSHGIPSERACTRPRR